MIPKHFYTPLILVFFLFILDKAVLISDFRTLGGDEKTPIENMQILLGHIWDFHKKNTKKPLIAFFGSSRSEIFQYASKTAISNSPYLNTKEREWLLNYELETRGIAKASEFLYSYFAFESIIKSEIKPEIVFIEVSPEMFNMNNPFHASYHYKLNRFELHNIWELFTISESFWKSNIIKDLMFLSSYYKFKPEVMISRKIYGYKENDFAIQLFSKVNPIDLKINSFNDFDKDSLSREDYEIKIINYSRDMVETVFAKNYKVSNSEMYYFKKIQAMALENNVNVVFWTPKVHPYYNQIMQPISLSIMLEVQEILKANDFKYIDLRNVNLKCNRYTDSSHLSPNCAPEVLSILLKDYME